MMELVTDGPRRTTSHVHLEGVAKVLAEVRDTAYRRGKEMLESRRSMGYADISDEEIEAQALRIAKIAGEACGTAVGEAFQLGVNQTAEREQHERRTTPVPK